MTIQSSSPFTFNMMAATNTRPAAVRKPQFQGVHSQSVQTISSQQTIITRELDQYLKGKSDADSRVIYAKNLNLKGYFQQLASTYECFKWIKQKAGRRELEQQEQRTLHKTEKAIPQTEFEAELTDTLENQKTLIGELKQPQPNPEQLLTQIPQLQDNYEKLHTFYNTVLQQIGYAGIKARIDGLRQRLPISRK